MRQSCNQFQRYRWTRFGIILSQTGALLVLLMAPQTAMSEETAEGKKPKIEFVDASVMNGTVKLRVPKHWESREPSSRIVEREYAIPPVDGDQVGGRLTLMASGGSIKLNIERWNGQFIQPDGKSTEDVAKVIEKKVHGQDVTIVDITGTFKESSGGGPFAPGKITERPGYRMLGGIVQTKGQAQYFFKLTGPAKTLAEAEQPFMQMMESISSSESN